MVITRSMKRRRETYQSSLVSPDFDLPMDLISDILSRLPVKSLLQFKSVCKAWYSLIENPNFTKKQLTRSNQNPSITSVLITGRVPETGNCGMWVKFRGNTTNNAILGFDFYPCLVGICDGLVCAMFSNFETIVCNPTTGKVRKIPQCGLQKVKPGLVFFGFTFQDSTGYSLYRIVHSCSQSGEIVIRGEVYAMSTNIWREIEVKREIYTGVNGCRSPTPVDINGVFYWEVGSVNVVCVMSFDTGSYVFGEIAYPEGLMGSHSWKLMNFKGELALLVHSGIRSFDLWVLNRNGKSSWTWTKKFRMEDLPLIGFDTIVVGCERNNKLVMQNYLPESGSELFTFDLESHLIEYLPFSGNITIWHHRVYLYTESLLLV